MHHPIIAVTDWTFSDLSVEEQAADKAGAKLVCRQCRDTEDLIVLSSDADAVITQFAKLDAGVIGRMAKARAIVRYGIGVDNVAWGAPYDLHSSLGSYSAPWFSGAPGLSQGLTNLIWMQPVWLGGGTTEGIASMVTWKAPQNGVYAFSGLFVAGDQTGNGASVAIVDSLGGSAPLSRTVLTPNTTQSISFTKSYAAGDVVQFQVGSDFKTGNAVGLQINVSPVVTTNVILTLQTSTNLSGQWQNTPITSNMITPAGKLNVGSLTNTNTFYRLEIRTEIQ